MKITGATALDSLMEDDDSAPEVVAVSGSDQAYGYMVVRDSVQEGRDDVYKNESDAAASHNLNLLVDEGVVDEVDCNEEFDQNFDVQSALEGDGDFLDLLVESLDEEFDPNFLI